MNLYVCRVFRFDHADASVNQADWTTTRIHEQDRATVPGHSCRQAAAEAYVMLFGFSRSLSLSALGTPQTAVDFEASPERVCEALKKSICPEGPCYYFDNGVEVFYIVVTALDPVRSLRVRQKAMIRFMCSN